MVSSEPNTATALKNSQKLWLYAQIHPAKILAQRQGALSPLLTEEFLSES